jgi:hypothetical protein
MNETATPAEATPADLIAEYIELREEKKVYEEKIKEAMHDRFEARMDAIEANLMAFLLANESEGVRTPTGTAFKRVETSVTVGNQDEFRRHVIGTQQWELIDFRANKTAVKTFVEEHEGQLPPGVNMNQTTVISVRKPSS